MDWVKAFIADNLSGFSVDDIPNYIFTLFLAGIWAWIFRALYLRGSQKTQEDKTFARQLVIIAIAATIAITIIRFSIPLAIGFAALLALIRFKAVASNARQGTYLFVTLVTGLGIGSGYGIIASMGLVLVAILLFLTANTKGDD